MSELLPTTSELSSLARISVEDFHRISELGIYGKRTELIRGIVFEKMSISPLHRKLGKRLHDFIYDLRLPGHLVFLEAPLTLRDSEPQPDVTVVKGEGPEFDHAHPTTAELVIEIAVASERQDREMATIYAEAGVKEYWIVLANRNQIEVHRTPTGGEYQESVLATDDEELVCRAVPEIRVSLTAMFA